MKAARWKSNPGAQYGHGPHADMKETAQSENMLTGALKSILLCPKITRI